MSTDDKTATDSLQSEARYVVDPHRDITSSEPLAALLMMYKGNVVAGLLPGEYISVY